MFSAEGTFLKYAIAGTNSFKRFFKTKIFGQYLFFKYICIFIRVNTTRTNIFEHSFVKM